MHTEMITFYLLKEIPETVRTRWKKVSANSLIERSLSVCHQSHAPTTLLILFLITPSNYTETIDVMLSCMIVSSSSLSIGLSTSNIIFVMRRNNQNIIYGWSQDTIKLGQDLRLSLWEHVQACPMTPQATKTLKLRREVDIANL